MKFGGVLLFRLCFEKGVWLLVSCFIRGSSSSQNWRSKLDKIAFLVGFQKGRFGLRGTCYCDRFCVIFGTKLGGVLLFRLCFEKGVWLLVSCFRDSSSNQNWRSKVNKIDGSSSSRSSSSSNSSSSSSYQQQQQQLQQLPAAACQKFDF